MCGASRNSILAFDNRMEHYYITRKCVRCRGGGDRKIDNGDDDDVMCVVCRVVEHKPAHTHTIRQHMVCLCVAAALVRSVFRPPPTPLSDSLPLNNL